MEAKGVVSVRAGEVSVTAEVHRADESFVNLLEGARIGGPAGLDFALHRLTTGIRRALPVVAPPDWEVTVHGSRGPSVNVTFADKDLRFDADDDWREEMWALVQELPRHTLSDAIESAAELVKRCVRPEQRLFHRISGEPAT